MKAVSAVRPQPKRGAHTVVLGCATSQRGHIVPLVEALATQELHVELVSGIDQSPQRWREAAGRYGTRAVYIACGGPTVPPATLGALRDELRTLGIPASSVWTGVVDWRQVDQLIRNIERMMAAAPIAVPPPPLSRSSGPILIAPANNEPTPAMPPPIPGSSVRPSSGPSSIAASSPTPAPVAPPAPMPIPGPLLVPGPPVAPGRLAPMGASFDHGSGQVSVPSPAVAPHPPSSLDPTSSSMELRMRSRTPIILASCAVAVLGLMVLGWTFIDDDQTPAATEDSVAAREQPTPSSPPASAQPTPAGPAEQPVDDPSAPEATEPEPEPEPEAEPEPVDEPVDEVVDAPVGDDDALVHAALMKRKIRALDILLVSPEATKKIRRKKRVMHMSWSDAHAYCEELDIDGVKGWRLPTAGEFRTLSGSNMLDRRSYWSSTEADAFGSDRVVWNNLKKSMAPTSGDWKGGRVLCVRFQHPEQFHPS